MKFFVSTKTLVYCIILGVVLIVAGLVLGFRVFPSIVNKKVWESAVLTENTTQYDLFKKIPFPFQIKVNFFDVKNVPDILNGGAKPIVKEVGPFIYKLYRWKDEIEWENDEEISFYDYMRFEFDKEASSPLSDEDEVTILNSPYNAFLLTIEALSVDMLESVEPILPTVFNKYNGLFVKDKVKNILFNGQIFCKPESNDDFLTKTVCDQFRAKVKIAKGMKLTEDRSINYAYLDFKNNTHLGRFTINSGKKQKENVNHLIRFNNKTKMDNVWGRDETPCNMIKGAVMFRPFIKKNMTFDLFSEDICRTLPMEYKRTETVKGIEGFRFAVTNTSLNQPKLNNTNEFCYCINKSKTLTGDEGCLLDGVLDLMNCVGAPVLLSFPHLLYGAKEYINSVEGLTPNESLHDTYAIIEPISGTPLKVAKRVQFNMFIRAIPNVIGIENVTNALVPIFWLEESMTLDDEYIQMMKKLLLNTLKILEIIKWGLVGLGGIAVVIPTGLIMYN